MAARLRRPILHYIALLPSIYLSFRSRWLEAISVNIVLWYNCDMKKILISLVIFFPSISNAEQKSPASKIAPPTKYVENRLDQPYVYGHLSAARDKQIEIRESLNLECFDPFDYFEDSATQEKIDKANTKKLPWCDDPSGGTFHKPTGKIFVYSIDEKSQFFFWQLKSEKPRLAVKKEIFVKETNKINGELIKLKVRQGTKNTIDTIETVYTD